MKRSLFILLFSLLVSCPYSWAGNVYINSGGSSSFDQDLNKANDVEFKSVTVTRTDAPQTITLYEATSDGSSKKTVSVPAKGTGLTADRTHTLGNYDSTDVNSTSVDSSGNVVRALSGEILIDCTGSTTPYSYCTSSSASTFTAQEVKRTIVNSYGRGGAQTVTLPAAAAGYTFIAMVGTQHNSAWKIQRAGSDTITWSASGTDTTGKTYFQETNQGVGSRVSCVSYKSGASAWSWLCGPVTGTWVTD